MNLSPMRYKDFTWPHNPRVYTIDYERRMAENKVPYGLYHLQDLGRGHRVMRGEGEFVGPDAYAQFGALANVFYSQGSGPLIRPLWQAANAFFVELSLRQEPRPDYVSYSFVFWEDLEYYSNSVEKPVQAEQPSQAGVGKKLVYSVVKGDTLWGISKKYKTTVEKLLQLNPQIKNPNLIRVGQEVRVQ